MGRAYALAQGEARDVADAIRDHYKPVGAQDDVAPDDVSAAIALADRFDTLAGCFAVGLAPTGAADPFALRRACIGALRTLLDRGYALSFSEMVGSRTTGSRARSSTSRASRRWRSSRSSRPSACAAWSPAQRAPRWPTRS